MSGRDDHAGEVERGERFEFGRNWALFLRDLSEDRVREAEKSLCEMLEAQTLQGLTFLDIGSGSGLFSLAARRLGARVTSFDYDPESVRCTALLRDRFFEGDSGWNISRGSVLDDAFMASVPAADVVYSWGVLHHTGAMWRAVENASRRTAAGGKLLIAIYNDQGAKSRRWLKVKEVYCSGLAGRILVTTTFVSYFVARALIGDLLRLRSPLRRYGEYRSNRGMSLFRDWIDWLGGLPFEVASPARVIEFCAARGFRLRRMKDCGATHGCNEFLFENVGP
jgi:2-polyprenyl-6-hydroxyphenyl methylase/3-demethylubiquinone-9 3-methyltransferase